MTNERFVTKCSISKFFCELTPYSLTSIIFIWLMFIPSCSPSWGVMSVMVPGRPEEAVVQSFAASIYKTDFHTAKRIGSSETLIFNQSRNNQQTT